MSAMLINRHCEYIFQKGTEMFLQSHCRATAEALQSHCRGIAWVTQKGYHLGVFKVYLTLLLSAPHSVLNVVLYLNNTTS